MRGTNVPLEVRKKRMMKSAGCICEGALIGGAIVLFVALILILKA